MTEQTPQDTDPEEYRGGSAEPEGAKGGAGDVAHGGIVPDSASDDDAPADSGPAPGDDASAVEHDDVLGGFPEDPELKVDLSAGDDADATRDGSTEGARGSEAGLGRHEPEMDVEEEDVANQ